VKYYVYISDAKVDMLLPQVPHKLKKKVATEFKVDLKVFSASLKTDKDLEENRLSRLEAVVRHVRENESVGSIESPSDYFGGTIRMRWGPFSLEREEGLTLGNSERESDSPIVYFASSTESSQVGLGGSAKHVVGVCGLANAKDWGGSAGPVLLMMLLKNAGLSTDMIPVEERDAVPLSDDHYLHILGRRMEETFKLMGGPPQLLEFLAKRIVSGMSGRRLFDSQRRHIVLGTPIYVAMAE
jgi:hypothetical protein